MSLKSKEQKNYSRSMKNKPDTTVESPLLDAWKNEVNAYINAQQFGEGAIRIPAKMVFTGTACRGFVGCIAFSSPVKDVNVPEMWEGDLVFIPRRKAQSLGGATVGNWRADQILTSGFHRKDWTEPYWVAK